MVLPSPGFFTGGGYTCCLFPPNSPRPAPSKSCLWGRRKGRVLPFPTTFTQVVCILPDASVLQVTAARYPDLMLSLSEIAFGYWLPERCKPERAPARGVIQGAIWLIRSLSLSPSREVHDCPMQRDVSDTSQARARWHC